MHDYFKQILILISYFLLLVEWDDVEDEEISESESVVDYETNQSNGSTTNLNEGDKLPLEIIEAIKSLGLVDKVNEIYLYCSRQKVKFINFYL